MNEELQKKMNTLMYALTKEAARSSFVEWLEEWGITEEEYEQIKAHWKTLGINGTYV